MAGLLHDQVAGEPVGRLDVRECRDWRKVKTLVWREVNRRGTDITAYLENGGTLEKARQMAAHTSTRTTQLYDRREDRVTLDEVVKINIRRVRINRQGVEGESPLR